MLLLSTNRAERKLVCLFIFNVLFSASTFLTFMQAMSCYSHISLPANLIGLFEQHYYSGLLTVPRIKTKHSEAAFSFITFSCGTNCRKMQDYF